MVAVAENRSLSGVEPCFEGNCSDGINWYIYVENNPINYIDPYGLNTVAVGVNVGFTDIVNEGMKFVNFLQDKIAPDAKDIFQPTEHSSYTGSIGVYVDTENGDFGFYAAGGVGGGTPDLSISAEVIGSDLDPDEFLTGYATEVGTGVGYGVVGTQASYILNDDNEIVGYENSIGVGLGSPVEFHTDGELTTHFSVTDAIKSVFNNDSDDSCPKETE